jgi:hypothetical protein
LRLPILAAAALALPAALAAQATAPVTKRAPAPRRPAAAPAPASAGAPATAPAAPAAAPLPRTYDARPTGPTITAADLMSRLYPFADDSMMGRDAGTLGNVKATDYLAAEARRLGLQPAGDSGTYFQTLPYKIRSTDPASRFVVGGTAMTLGTDWVATGLTAARIENAPAVFGGTLGDSTALLGDALAGKVVVYRVPLTPGALRYLRGESPAPRAAAIVLVGLDPFMRFLERPAQFVDDPAQRAAGADAPPAVIVATAQADALFGRALDGLRPGATGRPLTLAFTPKVEPVPFPSRNVVAVLPGSDPALRGQYVAVGAHNDHVGQARRAVDHDSLRLFNRVVRPGGAEDQGKVATPAQQAQVNAALARWRAANPGTARADSIYNGADDDASGSVTVLEIAERLAAMPTKPKRSVLFVWHTGEEKGLLGSEWYTDHPTVPRDSVVAQLNIDMVGRGGAEDVTGETKDGRTLRGGPGYLQLVGSRRLSTELGDLVETVNRDARLGLRFDYSMDANGHPQNIYCRSDHYSYARYGIPVVFFTTGGHADYHEVTDEAQYIDYAHMARVGTLIADVAVRVADLDRRVRVDQPKPDPKGRCQQ